jgi:hypothetical protein
MRLHTSLTDVQVSNALFRAQREGLITPDVHFAVWEPGRSQTHPHAFEIQLGTYNQHSLPRGYKDQRGSTMHVRRFKNSGSSGASSVYAATWHEWGWLIAEIFAADPEARWGANPARCARPEYAWGYHSEADFHAKTDGKFRLGDSSPTVNLDNALYS